MLSTLLWFALICFILLCSAVQCCALLCSSMLCSGLRCCAGLNCPLLCPALHYTVFVSPVLPWCVLLPKHQQHIWQPCTHGIGCQTQSLEGCQSSLADATADVLALSSYDMTCSHGTIIQTVRYTPLAQLCHSPHSSPKHLDCC